MRTWFYALIAAGLLPALTWAEEFTPTGGFSMSVSRMVTKGYTEKQVRLLSWYLRVQKSS